MSLLGDLLLAKDPMLTIALKQLEDVTGRHGVDTALIGDLFTKAHERMRRLKLDPADTKGIELYQSLINLVEEHNKLLAKSIGGSDPNSPAQMVPLILGKLETLEVPRGGWFLKETVARRMLKQQPPPRVMQQLGYEEVDELLKSENIFEVYGALRFAESPQWLNDFITQYQKLTFKDFEHRQLQIVHADPKKWGDLADDFIAKKLHNATHLKELGVILMLPIKEKHIPGFTLLEFTFLLHYVYEVHLYSTYFKFISPKKHFAKLLVDTLIADTPNIKIMDGRKHIHWRVIQRYYGKLKNESHPEIFEPHVQPEDLHWRKAEDILYGIVPALEFWQDMDYVGLILDGEAVTFNLMDLVIGFTKRVPYTDRYLYHFRESLWNEIFERYMGEQALREEILDQLDNESIAPEKITVSK